MIDKDSAPVPPPPGLHWTIVLVLGIATLGLFGLGWAIVQAVWAKKFDSSSKALKLYIIAVVLSVVGCVLELVHASFQLQALVQVASALVATFGAFSVKNSLTAYMAGIERTTIYLSSLMTLIFGEVYLQYHMNRIRSYQRHTSLASAH